MFQDEEDSDVIGSYIIITFWLIILILLYQLMLHRRNIGEVTAPGPI